MAKKITLARVRTAAEIQADRRREEAARQAREERARAEAAAARQRLQLEPQREGAKIAERAIRSFEAMGARKSAAPTAERLLRAGGAARVEMIADVAEIQDGSRSAEVEVEIARVRVVADHFEMLAARRGLDNEPGRNLALAQAGRTFKEAWTAAGSLRLSGMKWAAPIDGGGTTELFAGERAASSLQRFQRMDKAIHWTYRPYVRRVVLDERGLHDVGAELSGYRGRCQAEAVARLFLKCGLEYLAEHLGLIPPREPSYSLPGMAEMARQMGLGRQGFSLPEPVAAE